MGHAVRMDCQINWALWKRRWTWSMATTVNAVFSLEAALPALGIGRCGVRTIPEVRWSRANFACSNNCEVGCPRLSHAERLDV